LIGGSGRFTLLGRFNGVLSTLRYGADSSVRLEFSDGVRLAECGTPRAVSLEDPAAATAEALAKPLEYPSLAKSTTPGDQVLVALGNGVPRAGEIVAAVVRSLVGAGVAPDGVAVLRTAEDARSGIGDPRKWLTGDVPERITVLSHDPDDRTGLAYLAATEGGEPILLHRAVVDADVVLPVGCIRGWPTAGYHGVHGVIFPTFSDRRAMLRFRSQELSDPRGRRKKRLLKEVDEVGWLLGVTLTIQVVPGRGDRVLHVLAGEVGAVGRRGRDLYQEAWRGAVPHRASLVVAAIEGGSAQQTWQNVGRALAAAGALVEKGGAIAVCCEVASEPGPAMQRLAAARSRGEALAQIRRGQSEDAVPAAQLADAQDRARVYLLSRLEESLVESLEMAPISQTDELERLVRQHESCILLANAPHAMVTTEENASARA